MTVRTMNHVGVVVKDLERAVAFFRALGFTVTGPQEVEARWLRRVAGVEAHHSELYGVTPREGGVWLELVRYHPARDEEPVDRPGDALGYRHLAYEVTDVDEVVRVAHGAGYEPVSEVVDYGDEYRLVYIRGPEGLLVEFAEPLQRPS